MTAVATAPKPARKRKPKPAADQTPFDRVGRLAVFGLKHPWQIPLLMPHTYEDFTAPLEQAADLDSRPEGKGALWLWPDGPVRHHYGRVPRTTVPMLDSQGYRVEAVAFGDTKLWAERLAGCAGGGLFVVQAGWFRGQLNVTLIECVDPRWNGRVRPRYPGKPKYMPPEKVLEKVHEALPVQIQHAASEIRSRVQDLVSERDLLAAAGHPGWTLEQLLLAVHLPLNLAAGQAARETLHRVAAFVGLTHAHRHVVNRPPAQPLTLATRSARLDQLPFTATDEQRLAMEDIAADMAGPKAMKRLLQADVGLGKTVPILVAMAATADAGGRAALLAPSTPLATQLHRDFTAWFPDLPVRLVTGELDDRDLRADRLLIGTTALLHRHVGPLSLVVVDEEQKFAVEQREALTGLGAHMLSATATCIPRTMALARYGAVAVSRLRTPHVQKEIRSRNWPPEARRELFAQLRQHVVAGGQLLVIYPKKDATGEEDALSAVDSSYAHWERLFPGLVRTLHSEADDAVKDQVLADMRSGAARVLVATTVVEVGITIPDLRRVLIVSPERLGLAQLHQLRGRVARTGGVGWCDLYSPTALKDEQKQKLDAFLACKDGFEVAELDMRLRGFGDLSMEGSQQSGSDNGVLFGTQITPSHVEPMEALWGMVNGT